MSLGFESKPGLYVSFCDALRVANWLHDGQPHAVEDATTTADGAYAITDDGSTANTLARNDGARAFLPG